MAAKGEVDLIIRAKNEASKSVDAITKALKSLSDQQTIVGDSADRADDRLAQLSLQLAQLRTNAQNLQSLASISDVLNGAAQALTRQRAAADEAGEGYTRVVARQAELSAESQRLEAAVKQASDEFTRQDNALKNLQSTLTELGKESRGLSTEEAKLQRSLESTAKTLERQSAALEEAKQKQIERTQAVAASERVTKAQQNALEAANRQVERRQAALDATVAKEAQLRAELERNRAAQVESTAAVLNANAAVNDQAAKTQAAKAALEGFKVQADSLAKAERAIVKDVEAAAAAVEKQQAALNEAQSEFGQLKTLADQAKSAVAQQADATERSGSAAARAAVQVATFAARLAVLRGAGSGKTSVPELVDPAKIREAEGVLRTLSVTLKAASNDATSASVSAEELQTALEGVGKAKGELEGIGNALKAQQTSVTAARDAWKAAEAEVRRLAQAIKSADEPSEELAAAFGKAQGAARLAKDEFLRQKSAAEQNGAALKAAGIGAGDLASAEAALAPRIRAANDMLQRGQQAAQQMSTGLRNTEQSTSRTIPPLQRLASAIGQVVSQSGRMTTSLARATNPLRGFRSELTSMIAAGVGLYGLKTQLESIWEVGTQLEANRAKFNTAFGGLEEGNRQLAYAREVALNLKLPLETLTKGYADLALSARGTSMEGEGIRRVFEAFAQTARVNQSSAADLEGVFRALTQIMSKGKVQAEELRGQLGDRLPGALQIMADGLGISVEELDKMMEQGELTRETLLAMASEVSARVAPVLAQALDSPAAKLANFQNRMTVFKETIAQSGFLDAVANAFERLAEALSTPEALQAAEKLGVFLGDVVTWAAELINSGNLEAIGSALVAIGSAWAALQIGSIISGLVSFATQIARVARGSTLLRVGFAALATLLSGPLGIAIGAIIALFAAWKLAEWAYDNFPVFAEGVMKVRTAALEAWDAILEFWEKTAVRLKHSFTRITAELANIWYGMMNKILGTFPALTEALGLGGFASEIAQRAAEANAAVVNSQANMQAELDGISERYAEKERQRQYDLQQDIEAYYAERTTNLDEMLAKEGELGNARGPQAPAGSQAGLGQVTYDGPDIVAEARARAEREAAEKEAARKRLTLERQVADQMYSIRAQLETKSAETLEEKLAAVPAKYAKLYDQLRQLGKDQNSEEWRTVDALVAQEQQIIRNTEAKKAEREADRAAREAERAEDKRRKEAMEHINVLLQTRKNIQEQLAQAQAEGDSENAEVLKDRLEQITEQAQQAITSMIEFWQSVGGVEGDAAIAKLEAMRLQLTKVKEEGILTGQAIGNAFTGQLTSAVNKFVDGIAETGDVIGSLKDAFRQFAIDFLKQIAQMIIQQLIFNAISGFLGGPATGATAGSAGSLIGNLFHNGGTVGAGTQTRSGVSPSIFANAVKYHGGGVAGLRSNEVPAILKAGEVVRTQEQERALANRMAAANNGGGGAGQSIKIINQIDSGDMVATGIGSAAGEKALVNAIGKNRDTIKRMLG